MTYIFVAGRSGSGRHIIKHINQIDNCDQRRAGPSKGEAAGSAEPARRDWGDRARAAVAAPSSYGSSLTTLTRTQA